MFATHIEVAIGGGDVHDAGTVVERDEVVADDEVALAEVRGIAGARDTIKQAGVAGAGELAAGVGGEDGMSFAEDFFGQAGGEDDFFAFVVWAGLGQHIVGIGVDGQGHVGGQGPGGGGPCQECGTGEGGVEGVATGVKAEAQPDRGVIDVVFVALVDFGIAEGGATARAVHGDFVVAEEQIAIPELAQDPPQ